MNQKVHPSYLAVNLQQVTKVQDLISGCQRAVQCHQLLHILPVTVLQVLQGNHQIALQTFNLFQKCQC